MNTQIKVNQDFKKTIHPLLEEEFNILEQNCIEEGIRDAIIVWSKTKEIIDGHNRFEIATKHNLKYDVVEKDFDTISDVKQWMYRNQLGRRNITKDMFDELIGRLYNGSKKDVSNEKGVNQFNRSGANLATNLKTQELISNQYGISPRTVMRNAKKVENLDKVIEETPEIEEVYRNRKVSLSDISELAKLEPEKQKEFVKAVKEDKVKDVKEFRKEQNKIRLEANKEAFKNQDKSSIKYTPKIFHQSYKDFLPTVKDADLLVTDPPFSTDIDDIKSFVNDWLPLALDSLKDSARGYICIGAYPKEIQAYIDYFLNKQDRFVLDNPLIWTYRNTLGVTPKRKYNLNYQMILHFYSSTSDDLDTSVTNEIFSVQDINAPDGRIGDRFHKWQKPNELARRLIKHSSKENDIIIDPFSGSGTFLVQAGKMNRIAMGCDIDNDAVNLCKERGCDVQ